MPNPSQHTPGPWTLWTAADRTIYVEGTDRATHHRFHIARMTGSSAIGDHRAVIEANARLIAAAPDMLALIGTLVDQVECFYGGKLDRDGSEEEREAVRGARALLARIEGNKT